MLISILATVIFIIVTFVASFYAIVLFLFACCLFAKSCMEDGPWWRFGKKKKEEKDAGSSAPGKNEHQGK